MMSVAWGAALGLALALPDTVPVVALEPVTVVGSRVSSELPLSTRGVQVLDREYLDRIPASTIAEALRGALGLEVSSRSPAQVDIQLRGGTFEQVLVLVDGVRVSDAQTGHFDMNLTLPLDQVERIEILRGPGSAQYGSDALGGVIHIVTRNPPKGEWGGRLEGGSFGTGTLALQQSLALPGNVVLQGFGEVGRSDGHRDGTEWDQQLLSLKVEAPLQGGQVRASGGLASRAFGARDFYAPFPSVEDTGTQTLRIEWSPAPTHRVRLTPGMHWRRHTDDFVLIRDRPEVYRNQHTSVQQGADLTLHFPVGTTHFGAVGADWTEHSLRSSALGDHGERRYAVFGELGGTLAERLDVTLGLRHDGWDAGVDGWHGVVSPSAAASLSVGADLRLRASWGRAFRSPTWTERYYADPGHIPNPDLGPEQGYAVELGVQGEVADAFTWSLAGHQRTTRDLIDWARPALPSTAPSGAVPGPWVPRNVGWARFSGIEGEARWAPAGLDGLWIALHVTALRVRAETPDGLESKYALRPLVQQLGLQMGRSLPGGWSMMISGFRGKRGGPGLAVSEAPYVEWDARLQHATGWLGLVPWIDARNLGGSQHLDLTGNPVPGRRWTVGVRTAGSR